LKVEPAPVEEGAEEDELAAEDGAVLDADAPDEEALAEEEPEADVRGNVEVVEMPGAVEEADTVEGVGAMLKSPLWP